MANTFFGKLQKKVIPPTTSSPGENIITLFSPHDHPQDTNSEENAHSYQTLARFITICFKRRKQFQESLSPVKKVRTSFAQYCFQPIISFDRTVSYAVSFLTARMIQQKNKELNYHKTFNIGTKFMCVIVNKIGYKRINILLTITL